MCAVDLRLVCVIIVIINIIESKRYDIHQQCKDDYGLDLDGVLRQFRRSDDYLQILKWTTLEFKDFYMDVMIEGLDYNIDQLRKKINADMGIQETTTAAHSTLSSSTTTTTESPEDRSVVRRRRLLGGRRQDIRPQGVMTDDSVKNEKKVRRLDSYSKLNSYLTVEERNNYKDLGFTYAGEAIHTVIMGFGGNPVEEVVRSTRLFQQSDKQFATTQHMLKHIPTKDLKSQSKTAEQEMTVEDGAVERQDKRGHTRFALVAKGRGLGSFDR